LTGKFLPSTAVGAQASERNFPRDTAEEEGNMKKRNTTETKEKNNGKGRGSIGGILIHLALGDLEIKNATLRGIKKVKKGETQKGGGFW